MEKIRELQLMELNILKETLKVFEKNDIPYFALCGTMLGAVRHKGFIPWDDDIDVGVPREYYEKLPGIMEQLPGHLRFHNYLNDPEYMYYFSRVEDNRMIVTSDRTKINEETPVWIDIFPLDGMPNGLIKRKFHGYAILARKAFYHIARFDRIVNINKKNRSFAEKAVIWTVKTFRLQKWFGWKKTFEKFDKMLKKYPYEDSDYNINALSAYKLREMVEKKIFGEGAMYSFEDIQIRGPEDYEAYLTQLYGDWRTPADFTHHGNISFQE